MKRPRIRKTCESCVYWHKGTEECRRHAPTYMTNWVRTEPWAWCGDHREDSPDLFHDEGGSGQA